MAFVISRKSEEFEGLYKRFKRKVFAEGLLKEVKNKKRYNKPSEKRRMKEIQRLKKIRKYKLKELKREQFKY